MSLKVNVIYNGIIYRVKGMKVLCLIILTVILLLFALVAMGVWMLINFRAKSGQVVISPNSISKNLVPNELVNPVLNTTPSIEFGNSKDIFPSDLLKTPGKPNEQDVGLIRLDLQRPGEQQSSEIYGSVFYDTNRKDKEKEILSKEDKFQNREVVLENRDQHSINLNTAKPFIKESSVRIIPDLISKASNTEVLSDRSQEIKGHSEFEQKHARSKGIKQEETFLLPENIQLTPLWKERTISSLTITNIRTTPSPELFKKNGVLAKNIFTYIGPPVVGYGSNPYEIMTKERIYEYDNFWRTYGGKKGNESNFLNNEGSIFIEEDTINKKLRPHLRGLHPSVVKYDMPIRPNPQTSSTGKVSSSLADNHPSGYNTRLQPTQNASIHHLNNLKRKLYMGIQKTPSFSILRSVPLTTTIRPNLLLNGPLQGLYDYSKKLAASLLSFNSKSANKIQNLTQRLGEYGINLIENHSQVFKQSFNPPIDRIVALIPSAERLRSLDTFELSLITWTFLDYWEFLIEKVGTLSHEDLTLLQQRLDRLRKKKDDTMTRVLVNETLNHYSSGKQRSTFTNVSLNFNDSGKFMPAKNRKVPSIEEVSIKNPSPNMTNGSKFLETSYLPSGNNGFSAGKKENQTLNSTVQNIHSLLTLPSVQLELEPKNRDEDDRVMASQGRSSIWDPLILFTSKVRIEFMQFAVKVLFNFGKVFLRKPYALDCTMLLYCKDLNQDTKKRGLAAVAAKLKSVGLKVLTESEQQLRESDTFGQVWRSITAWTPLQCDVMFPRCDGPKALEIVNEVAMGS